MINSSAISCNCRGRDGGIVAVVAGVEIRGCGCDCAGGYTSHQRAGRCAICGIKITDITQPENRNLSAASAREGSVCPDGHSLVVRRGIEKAEADIAEDHIAGERPACEAAIARHRINADAVYLLRRADPGGPRNALPCPGRRSWPHIGIDKVDFAEFVEPDLDAGQARGARGG